MSYKHPIRPLAYAVNDMIALLQEGGMDEREARQRVEALLASVREHDASRVDSEACKKATDALYRLAGGTDTDARQAWQENAKTEAREALLGAL